MELPTPSFPGGVHWPRCLFSISSALQPNLLSFPQQQGSLLLSQPGPSLASQVRAHLRAWQWHREHCGFCYFCDSEHLFWGGLDRLWVALASLAPRLNPTWTSPSTCKWQSTWPQQELPRSPATWRSWRSLQRLSNKGGSSWGSHRWEGGDVGEFGVELWMKERLGKVNSGYFAALPSKYTKRQTLPSTLLP